MVILEVKFIFKEAKKMSKCILHNYFSDFNINYDEVHISKLFGKYVSELARQYTDFRKVPKGKFLFEN